MINVTIYVRPDCPACDQAVKELEALQEQAPHRLVKIDVAQDRALDERFGGRLPVVEIGPYRLWTPFKQQDLLVMLNAARDRVNQLEKVDSEGYQRMVAQGQKMTSHDRLSLWLSRRYMLVVNLLLLLYVGLPILAPVLMKARLEFPARVIYTIYSPLCHQLAFRSWFLFGEQAYYPRALAGIPNVLTYEEVIGGGQTDVFAARAFTGNNTVGYKVALCQRDVAIYGALLFFGLIFMFTGRRLSSIPWYLWVIFGLVPMGIDGVSQLPSIASNLPAWIPLRESTPALRSLTGFLFGWFTGWYLFPMIEASMQETRRIVLRKKAFIEPDFPKAGS